MDARTLIEIAVDVGDETEEIMATALEVVRGMQDENPTEDRLVAALNKALKPYKVHFQYVYRNAKAEFNPESGEISLFYAAGDFYEPETFLAEMKPILQHELCHRRTRHQYRDSTGLTGRAYYSSTSERVAFARAAVTQLKDEGFSTEDILGFLDDPASAPPLASEAFDYYAAEFSPEHPVFRKFARDMKDYLKLDAAKAILKQPYRGRSQVG